MAISAASSPVKKQPTPANRPPAVGTQQQVATATQWQGPLPPPDALEKFNAIVENGAERVFSMAEQEQAHRLKLERDALDANIATAQSESRIAGRGNLLGAAISMLAILSTLGSVALGAHWSVSVALVGVPIMSAVRALILRK